MSELNLLAECISTEGDAENSAGVKYIYMDPDTIYRFENNRMKKVNKATITKARRQIQLNNKIKGDPDEDVVAPPVKKPKKEKAQPVVVEDSDAEEEEEPEPLKPIKKTKRPTKAKTSSQLTPEVFNPNIDLNEYYNNKNKMEFMNLIKEVIDQLFQ